jgi:hypothetical protein
VDEVLTSIPSLKASTQPFGKLFGEIDVFSGERWPTIGHALSIWNTSD